MNGSDSECSLSGNSEFDLEWTEINTADIHVDCEDCARGNRQVHTNYFDEDAREAFNLFRVARVYITRIPLEITRHRRMKGMSQFCSQTLLKLLDTVVKRVASVIFPTDGCGLYSRYCARKASEGKMVRRMINLLRKLRRGSVEKRAIRACLFSSMKGRELYEMMRKNEHLSELVQRDGEEDEETNGNDDEDERRTLTNDNNESNAGRGTNGVSNGEAHEGLGRETAPKCLSGGFRRVQLRSRNDWLTMVATGGLDTEQIRRKHFSDEVLVRMLAFLFRADNVVLLSWGTKRVSYNRQYHRFPAVMRKSTAEGLWRRFNEETGIGNNVAHVGRSVFRRIVAYLTKGQLEARCCIDYYQEALVNENVAVLKEIIRKETDENTDCTVLERRLEAVAGFLKYNYRNHLEYECNDGYHCIQHGLLRGRTPTGGIAEKKTSTCKLCLCTMRIIKDIRQVVVSTNPSISTALDDDAKKFQLYMGHCLRAKVQQDRITKAMEEMKDAGKGKRCVIYMDFKMKQLPKKLREPSQDWFGKRGMTWHGTAVFYGKTEQEHEAEDVANRSLEEVRMKRSGKRSCKTEVRTDGVKRGNDDLKLFFIDTVVENRCAQDTMTSANLLDSICMRLKQEISGLEEVVIMSDNAPNYVNLTFPLISYYILKSHGLRLLEVLHPDAQQSKNMVDAHFGIGGRQIDKFIRERNLAVLTPDDIAKALVYDGRMKATGVDFVRVNQTSRRVKKWFAARDDKDSDFDSIGTCGVIMFQPMENGCVHVTTEKHAGGSSSHYVMEEYKILSGGEDGEDIDYSMQAEGAVLDSWREFDVMGQGTEDANEENGQCTMDSDMRRIAESIAGGTENMVPRSEEEVRFSRRAPIGVAPYTGAAMKFMSTIQFWDRKVILDCKEAFLDAQAEIELEEEETDERREQMRSMYWHGNRSLSEIPSDKKMEGMDGNMTGAIHSCSKCRKKFRYVSNLGTHEEICGGGNFGRTTHQSTLERAAEIASRLVYEGSIEHDIIYNPLGRCVYLDDMNIDIQTESVELEQGWAVRPKDGETCGTNYEPRYRPLVDKWFDVREVHKEKRMSAGMMYKTIRAMFPRKYDFPSERSIKNRINARAGAVKRRQLKEQKAEAALRSASDTEATRNGNLGTDTIDMEHVESGVGVGSDAIGASGEEDAVKSSVQENVGDEHAVAARSGPDMTSVNYGDNAMQSMVGRIGYITPPGVQVGATPSTRSVEPQSGSSEIVRNRPPGGSSDNGTEVGNSTSIRQGVGMKHTYSTAILAILGENPRIKRGAVYKLLLENLGLNEGELPGDFPSVQQVANKVSNFRRASKDGGEGRPPKKPRKV